MARAHGEGGRRQRRQDEPQRARPARRHHPRPLGGVPGSIHQHQDPPCVDGQGRRRDARAVADAADGVLGAARVRAQALPDLQRRLRRAACAIPRSFRRTGDGAGAGPRARGAGNRPRRQAQGHPRPLHGDPHQRQEPRPEGVLAGLCARAGARPADPVASGQSGRRRAHARVSPAQLHRQSDRSRRWPRRRSSSRARSTISRTSSWCCRTRAACFRN